MGVSNLPKVGDKVRIERDETKYPSKGTWPKYCGKTGTVVEVNLGEFGVSFGNVNPRKSRPGTFDWKSNDVAWFQPYEITVMARRDGASAVGATKRAPRALVLSR